MSGQVHVFRRSFFRFRSRRFWAWPHVSCEMKEAIEKEKKRRWKGKVIGRSGTVCMYVELSFFHDHQFSSTWILRASLPCTQRELCRNQRSRGEIAKSPFVVKTPFRSGGSRARHRVAFAGAKPRRLRS